MEQRRTTFGRWLKEFRLAYKQSNGDIGLTADELGGMVGVSHAYISRLERGERRPSATLIDTMALKFGVDTNFLRELAGLPLVDKSRKESPTISQIIKVLEGMSQEKLEMSLNLIKAFSHEKPPKQSSEQSHRKGRNDS